MKMLSWPRQHKWLAIFAFVLLIVLGLFAYQKIALELNRRAFAEARITIDTIYSDIVKEVGRPDNYRRTSECSRPNQAFGKGPLSCLVGTSFNFKINNINKSNELVASIQSVVNRHSSLLNRSSSPPSDIRPTPAPSNYKNDLLNYYKTAAGIPCTVKYDRQEDDLGVVLDCSDFAEQQFYPFHQSE